MAKKKRLLGLLTLAAVLVVVAVVAFHAGQKKKTARQAAQAECATKAYQDYLSERQQVIGQLVTAADVEKLFSVEKTRAKRRVVERFCLRFAQCLIDPNNRTDTMAVGAYFSSCIRDEAPDEGADGD